MDGSSTDASAVLDGFTITGGNGPAGFGGGGGVMIYSDINSDSAPRLVNCLLKDNRGRFGGGIRVFNADLDMINCTLTANRAFAKGGGIEVSGSSIAMPRNSILWGNRAEPPATGPEIANASGSATTITVRFCDVEGGQAGVDRSGGGGLDWGTPTSNGNLVANPVFAGADDFRLSSTSPCTDTGNNGAMPSYIVADPDGNPRILNGVINSGAYEGFDCNGNGREDVTDIAIGSSADADDDRIPDECEVLVSAVSRTDNPNPAAGGSCVTPAVPFGTCVSEPHQPGIREVQFIYTGNAAGSSLRSIEAATCAAPTFALYTGTTATCKLGPGLDILTCTFEPELANARTYRFNLTGGSVKIRALVGDVNGDG